MALQSRHLATLAELGDDDAVVAGGGREIGPARRKGSRQVKAIRSIGILELTNPPFVGNRPNDAAQQLVLLKVAAHDRHMPSAGGVIQPTVVLVGKMLQVFFFSRIEVPLGESTGGCSC